MHRPASSSSNPLRTRCAEILQQETELREGGGKAGQQRQHKLGRLLARERIERLLDKGTPFFEVGIWAAYKMYEQWGKITAAGTVAGIGNVRGVPCMIVANDATVKAVACAARADKEESRPRVCRSSQPSWETALPAVPTFRFCATRS